MGNIPSHSTSNLTRKTPEKIEHPMPAELHVWSAKNQFNLTIQIVKSLYECVNHNCIIQCVTHQAYQAFKIHMF